MKEIKTEEEYEELSKKTKENLAEAIKKSKETIKRLEAFKNPTKLKKPNNNTN